MSTSRFISSPMVVATRIAAMIKDSLSNRITSFEVCFEWKIRHKQYDNLESLVKNVDEEYDRTIAAIQEFIKL